MTVRFKVTPFCVNIKELAFKLCEFLEQSYWLPAGKQGSLIAIDVNIAQGDCEVSVASFLMHSEESFAAALTNSTAKANPF
jgi:hypothetical protein